MGLFDVLEQAVGIGAEGSPQGDASPQNVVSAVIQMVQSQPGGLGGVIEHFEAAGLGGVAQSWLSAGASKGVTPGQVQSVLGPDPIAQVAGRLGVTEGQAAGHIAQSLPMILDHLSPNGQAPSGGAMGALTGLLAQIGAR